MYGQNNLSQVQARQDWADFRLLCVFTYALFYVSITPVKRDEKKADSQTAYRRFNGGGHAFFARFPHHRRFCARMGGGGRTRLFAAHIILNRRWFGGFQGQIRFPAHVNTRQIWRSPLLRRSCLQRGSWSSKHLLGFWSFPEAWRCGKFIPPPPTGLLVLASAHIGLHWNAIKQK